MGTFFDRKPVLVAVSGSIISQRSAPNRLLTGESVMLTERERHVGEDTKNAPDLMVRSRALCEVEDAPVSLIAQVLFHVFGTLHRDLDDFGGIEFTIAAFGGFCHGTCEISEGLSRDGFGA